MEKGVLRVVVFLVAISLPTGLIGQEHSRRFVRIAAIQKKESGQLLVHKLKELEETFLVKFMYNPEVLDNKYVTGTPRDGSLHEQLNEILFPHSLAYERIDYGYYAIGFAHELAGKTGVKQIGDDTPGTSGALLASRTANPTGGAENTLQGKVLALDTGIPVPGASVMIRGSGVATLTDEAGEFRLELPEEQGLMVVSYIGYHSEERKVHQSEEVAISLRRETKELGEVVVTGYANTPLKDVTGSVSLIRNDEIERVPVLEVNQALQGRAAGVFVSNSHANPGGETNVRIRGVNSILGNNEPLYVIDGFIGGNINAVNPNDIESIDILKDASSTAIFGTRGSNGVVMVTTRMGGEKKEDISFDSFYGFQSIRHKLHLMNAKEYAQYANRIVADRGLQPLYPNPDQLEFDTDWQDEIIRTAPWQQHTLSARGGTAGLSYYLSGAYANQQGIVENTGYKRYNARANIDARISRILTVGTRLGLAHTVRTIQEGEEFGRRDDTGHPVARALQLPSTIASRDVNGEVFPTIMDHNDLARGNPLFSLQHVDQQLFLDNITGNVYAALQLSKNLKFRTSFGFQLQNERMTRFKPATVLETTTAFRSTARQDVSKEQGWLQENYFTYQREFGKHSFQVIAGGTLQAEESGTSTIVIADLPGDIVWAGNIAAIADDDKYHTESSMWRQVSAFSSIHYGWADRYLFTFNSRYDGNSKFGEGNKWAFFPSGAVAWRVSEESFMKNLGMTGDLKIRSSYGVSGSEALGPYNSIAAMTSDPRGYMIGDEVVGSYYFSRLGNRHLRWERTVQFDAGVDLNILAGRMTFTFDYFDKRTYDLFLNQRVPETTGVRSMSKNIGVLKNEGVELALNARPVVGALSWQIGANATFLNSEILSLDGREEILTGVLSGGYNIPTVQVMRIGESLGTFYGYRTDGVWQPSEIPTDARQFGLPVYAGDLKVVDLNGDGDVNEADRDVIGRAQPRIFGGINSELTYRQFDLSCFFNFVQGSHVFNGLNLALKNPGEKSNKHISMLDAWTPENTDTDIPRAGSRIPGQILDILVEDASFIRLREVTLGYSVPTTRLNKVGIEKLRVYVTGLNLLTFTRYTGYDPEVSIAAGSIDVPNFDNGSYPRARSVVVGLNLVF